MQGLTAEDVAQGGETGHGEAVLGAEETGLRVFQGQMNGGAIDGQQAQATPGSVEPELLDVLLEDLIKGLEGLGLELRPGFGEGLCRNFPGFERGLVQHLEELIQLRLQGRLGLIEEKKDQVLESQPAFAGEILRCLPVLGDEIGIIEWTGYILYNFQPESGGGRQGMESLFAPLGGLLCCVLIPNYMIFREKSLKLIALGVHPTVLHSVRKACDHHILPQWSCIYSRDWPIAGHPEQRNESSNARQPGHL